MLRLNWMTPQVSDDLVLSTNVCYDAVLLDQISDTLKDLSAQDLYIYADEYILYQTLESYHSVLMENIAIGSGLGELYPRVLEVFKDNKFLIVTPTWFFATIACKVRGLEFDTFEYTDFFRLDNDELLKQPHDILYIANPNGMNGTAMSSNTIRQLAGHFKYVIVDEAYADFSDIDSSVLANRPSNVIVFKTLSKSLALAGLRFGYCIADSDIILKIQELRPAYASNALSVYLVPKVLPLVAAHVERMKATRSYLESFYNLRKSQGNFILHRNEFTSSVKSKSVYQEWNRLTLCDIGTWNDIIQKP